MVDLEPEYEQILVELDPELEFEEEPDDGDTLLTVRGEFSTRPPEEPLPARERWAKTSAEQNSRHAAMATERNFDCSITVCFCLVYNSQQRKKIFRFIHTKSHF